MTDDVACPGLLIGGPPPDPGSRVFGFSIGKDEPGGEKCGSQAQGAGSTQTAIGRQLA